MQFACNNNNNNNNIQNTILFTPTDGAALVKPQTQRNPPKNNNSMGFLRTCVLEPTRLKWGFYTVDFTLVEFGGVSVELVWNSNCSGADVTVRLAQR